MNKTLIFRVMLVAYVLLIAWLIVSSVITWESTGLLHAKTNYSSRLVVGQADHQPVQIGLTNASVRLKPGKYTIFAFNDGGQASVVVYVSKKHTTNVSLGAPKSYLVPTLEDVKLTGFSDLLNYGMPSSQLDNLKLALFKYSPVVKNLSIITTSVGFAPHNPNSASTLSGVNFTVFYNSTAYKASLSYDNLSSYMQINLYNLQSNALVYTSTSNN